MSEMGRKKARIGTEVATEHHQMMRKIAPFAAVVILAACSRSSDKVQRGQQQYQVVQEGSASGVTSTITNPGDTPVPVTNTNVDTTGNLTLQNPNPMGNGGAAPVTVSGTLPSNPIYPATQGSAAPARPRMSVNPATNAPVVTDTIGSKTPAMPREGRTPPTSRDTTSTRPPETDRATTGTDPDPTSTSTSTAPATDTRKRNDRNSGDQQQPPPPPPPTDTTSTLGQQLLS